MTVELQQRLSEGRQFKKIILFFDRLSGAAAFRTGFTRTHFHVHLIENAILAGVASLVDVSIVADAAPQFLHANLVTVGSCADVVVIGDAHPIPQRAEFGRDFVSKFLRSLPRSFSGSLNFLSVLVGAG